MPKTPSLSSIPSPLSTFQSFYTKQPLLAVATTIVLPILGIIGLIYLRMKSIAGKAEEIAEKKFTSEKEVNEYITKGNVTLIDALALQAIDKQGGNRLLDFLSFGALKVNDLNLAWNSATQILDNPDMITYALCRMFNHLFNPENKSEGNLDQTFINIARSCTENTGVQNELTDKIFMRFLEQGKRELAFNSFLKDGLHSALTDHLSIKLFEACVAKNDQVLARKAVANISDSELKADYIKQYEAKWGTTYY